jgi:hypothetical protein
MKGWRHSGFSVDTSVRIEANDQAGMSRLVGYISRCPISLARMITRTDDGKIVYRASHANCWPFPKSGEQTVMEGIPRHNAGDTNSAEPEGSDFHTLGNGSDNHEIFEPLDFLAEMTQHVPDRGEHQIRYYGHYSNKSRGMRRKLLKAALVPKPVAPLTQQQLGFRATWAALIKLVYEVDPLKHVLSAVEACPTCGGTMKVIALIDRSRQPEVVEKILRHCKLPAAPKPGGEGRWREPKPRAPPQTGPEPRPREVTYDSGFTSTSLSAGFDRECA